MAPRTRRRLPLAGAGLVAVAVAVGAAVVIGGAPLGGSRTPTARGPVPGFVEETATTGLSMTYDGGSAYLEGGGVAAFDCSGDGRPELFVAGGTNPAGLFRNDSSPGGALRFSRIPSPVTDQPGVEGAYPLDVDGDGIADLVLLTVHGAHLLHGLGGCRFEAADSAYSFDGGTGWTTAFSATWERGAPLPTLAVGTYQRLDARGDPTFDCDTSTLLRPVSAHAYAAPVPLAPGYCTLSMLFSDWDRSGRRDLRVTNDRHYYADGSDQLWRLDPGAPPRAYTADDGWVSLQVNGMGIASADLTGDGLPEVYLTSQGDNKLQALAAGTDQPRYRDMALRLGVNTAQPATGGDTLPSTSWHPEFADVNNDGFTDLYVSKGNVGIDPAYAQRDPGDLFLGGPDGPFVQAAAAAGIVSFDRGRGAVVTDLNADGLPDLVLVNLGAPVRAWRNVGAGTAAAPAPMGHWLGVSLSEPGPNLDAVGALIEVRAGDRVMTSEVTVGGGHLSGELGPAHFGTGPAGSVDVRVTWPDGEVGPWQATGTDRVVEIVRGAPGIVAARTPGP